MILGTLFGYFTKVYLYHLNKGLPDKDIAGAIKVSPFFIKDYKSAAQQYPLQKLEQIFNILEEFDLRVKGINNRSLKEGELLKEMVTRILN
jgi:DNA polymerase-3 subunit delta